MRSSVSQVVTVAVLLAVALLILYYIAYELGLEVVSLVFLLGVPAVAGFVIMHYRPQGRFRGLFGALFWQLGIMSMAIVLSLISGLEGMICIVMAVGPIFLGTLVGGLIYASVTLGREKLKGRSLALTIPFLAVLLFGDWIVTAKQEPARTYVIYDEILIDASPEVVFSFLRDIPGISEEEVPTRLVHWLGVPKPTRAVWRETGDETIRYSHWGDAVRFVERITTLDENQRIEWEFEFPGGWVDEGIEDPHVEVGGQYFNVLSGGYLLEDHGQQTRLILFTRTWDNSRLGAYSEFWHRFFFSDFHQAILPVIKKRAETSVTSG